MQNEIFNRMLGMAVRAGSVVFGESGVMKCIRNKNAVLVIVAGDASDNTKKKFINSCSFYSVCIKEVSDRFTLERCTGRDFAVVMAVINESFANRLSELIEG